MNGPARLQQPNQTAPIVVRARVVLQECVHQLAAGERLHFRVRVPELQLDLTHCVIVLRDEPHGFSEVGTRVYR